MNKLLLAFALIAPIFSSPVYATAQTPAVHVAYGDLQLASAEGRAALDRRISRAIDTVCAVDRRSPYSAEQRAAQRCVTVKRSEIAPLRAAALASRGIVVQVLAAANR